MPGVVVGEPRPGLTFDAPELAGISGFRPYWDQPVVLCGTGAVQVVDQGEFGRAPSAVWDRRRGDGAAVPGALVVDALHRRALVRFPGMAEPVATRLAQGFRIAKVELILPYRDTEFWPFGYAMPPGMSFLGDAWVRTQPRWHVVAWALRRPWTADPDSGPTFNAWRHAAGYWSRFGAGDELIDRYPSRFGPVEVSYREATAYRDIEPVKQTAPTALDPIVAESAPPPGGGLMDDLLAEIEADAVRMERPDDFDQPARLDITAVLTDPVYGATVGERLRRFEACGMLLAKWETYDLRYKDVWSGYEWGTMTGGRGILMRTPALEVIFDPLPGGASVGPLPPPIDGRELAETLRARGVQGTPTARVATPGEFEALHAVHGARRPDWMPEWQWERIGELMRAEPTPGICEFPDNYDRYQAWIDEMLSWPPRMFIGHRTPRRAGLALRHRDAMPPPVRQHLETYWEGWLMPDRHHADLVHPQAIVSGSAQRDYLRETDDWRGNTSYYRGYVRAGSTMNFNHTSIAGALLGGRLLDARYPIDDARHGLEHLLLRQWAWLDGSTQETIDHYYLAITLFATKDMADFGPTPIDRLMARSALTKYIDELTTHYHPVLRRFISPSGRTALNFLWVTQDGTQHIMHSMARSGALRDMDASDTLGMAVLNPDYPARDVASQTLSGPWAPAWVARHVDGKPLPFEATAAFRRWGGYSREAPRWRRTYLTRHYGMASQDSVYGRVGFLAQWNRADAPVERVQDVGTLLVRPGANFTELVASDGGALAFDGRRAILQHRQTALILTQPPAWQGEPNDLRSLQTTLGFFDFRSQPDWDIYADGERIADLPFTGDLDRRLVIRDGATYIGIIPLPATDLGREYGLSVHRNERTSEIGGSGVQVGPALLVECYFLKKPVTRGDARRDAAPSAPAAALGDAPRTLMDTLLDDVMDDLTMTDEQRQALQRMAQTRDQAPSHPVGGVVIRLGDGDEFPDVEDFIAHVMASGLEWRDDPERQDRIQVRYRDGADGDVLEAGYRVDRGWFTDRKVNDEWPYLPVGIARDTPLSVQGDAGRLLKNGVALRTRPGAMMFLQADPSGDACLALNPLPDLRPLALELPNGMVVTADSLLGVTRLQALDGGARLEIDYAFKPEQAAHPDRATAVLVFGGQTPPAVVLNATPVDPGTLSSIVIDGHAAWIVPLTEPAPEPADIIERYRQSRILLDPDIPADDQALIQDWFLVGPFPNTDGSGFARAFGPETGPVDLTQTFDGIDGNPVRWTRLNPVAGTPVGNRGQFHLYQRYAPHHTWITVYAYTRIRSDRERDVLLLAGSDDTITVWLNGEKLHQHEVYRAFALDQERVPLRLREGDNHLLLKIGQGTGGWGFVARLADPRWGLPVSDGLTIGFPEAAE